MARTNVKGTQILDGSIGKSDLNITISGNAVITKVIGSNGLAITSSSGADSGTGDVTLAADLSFLNGKYPSLEVARTQNYVFAGPSSGSGNPAFRALVAGDIPAITISGVTGLQTALDGKVSGSGTSGYLAKYTGSLTHGNSVIFESSGNIGIGTTSPSSKLSFAAFWDASNETVGIDLYQGSISGGLPAYGIGFGPAGTEGYVTYRSGNNNTGTYGHKWIVNNVEVMRMRGDGRLGIGTTVPGQKLTVAGLNNPATTSGSTADAIMRLQPAGTVLTVDFGASNTGSNHGWIQARANTNFSVNYNFSLNPNGGNVGVGSTTPTYKLDVNGTGRFTGAVIFDAIPSTPIAATSANHIVNYATMQSYISGIKYDSVKVKTVALSNITLSGHQAISGYTTSGSDRVLVMGQSTASQNGVYISNSSTWTRDTNFDTEAEIKGFIHSVESGTYAGYKYINTNTGTITVGTTSVTYVEFSSLVETDPVFTASVAYGINSTNISNWNDAYTNRISTKTTADLTEGSNLYFTTARVLATALTGFSTGSNTAITASDTVLSAFQNLQGQINSRITIGGNTTGAAITIGTNDNYDFNLERNNAVQMAIKSGVIEANYDFDVKGKLKINGSTGVDHQFVKYNGTATVWATLDTGELSDKDNIVMLATVSGERGFQLFADTSKTYAESFLYTNPDAGISLGLHGYALDSSDAVKEFGMQLDTDGFLYHKRLDGTRSRIATVDTVSGGGNWSGGNVSESIRLPMGKGVYWGSELTGLSYQTLPSSTPVRKLLTLYSGDDLTVQAENNLWISGDKIYIEKPGSDPVEVDFSGVHSFPDGQYLRWQASTSGGYKKVALVSD